MDAVKIVVAAAAVMLMAAKSPVAPAPSPVPATVTPPSVRAAVEKWRAGDYPAAVAMWQPFAAAGDADALFNLGQAYKLGRGVTADAAVARDYYRKAAAKGHLPAQANLGIALFQVGEKPEAIKWLRTAADRGEARAQYVLGIAAFNGDGLPRSQALGYGYLLRAQASGLPQAATALGSITPALSPADRGAGEAVAASLAAGTGVPAALAAATAPRLIVPAGGVLKPAPAPQSLPIRTPPSATDSATASLPIRTPPTAVASLPLRTAPALTDASPIRNSAAPAVASSSVPVRTAPSVADVAVAAPKPAPAAAPAARPAPALMADSTAKPSPVRSSPPEVVAAKPLTEPPTVRVDAAAKVPPIVATTDVPASKPVDLAAPKPDAPAKLAAVSPPRPAPVALKPFETVLPPTPKKPDGWRVQLGAFSQRKLAETAWADVKATAAPAKPIYNADGAVVKLQMGPFTTRDAAKAACARLTEAGRACFVTQG